MDDSPRSQVPPRRLVRRGIVVGFVVLGLTAYGLWAYHSMHPEPGWLWVPRNMTATELFQEQGVLVEEVERFSVVRDMHLGFDDRAKKWWAALEWKEPRTWITIPKAGPSEQRRIEIKPRAYAMLPKVALTQGELLIFTRRGEQERALPKGCTTSLRSMMVFSDFTQVPGSEPWHLLASEGAASRVPPYGPMKGGMVSTCGPFRTLTVWMKVDDPKAWLREAAAIAEEEGRWGPPRWEGDRGVNFLGGTPKGSRLSMRCSEREGTVELQVNRR